MDAVRKHTGDGRGCWQGDHVMGELDEVNRLLNGRGVYVEILRWDEKAALVYVYRLSHSRETLIRREVIDLLSEYGYQDMSVEAYILHLKTRLLDERSCFPHEIGVFWGDPMKDVRGNLPALFFMRILFFIPKR